MKHVIPFAREDIENIIMNRIKEVHPDVTGLSISWVHKDIVIYMDKEPQKIRSRTFKDDT